MEGTNNTSGKAASIDTLEFRELLQAHINQFTKTGGLDGTSRAALIAHIEAVREKDRAEAYVRGDADRADADDKLLAVRQSAEPVYQIRHAETAGWEDVEQEMYDKLKAQGWDARILYSATPEKSCGKCPKQTAYGPATCANCLMNEEDNK